jgi:two-component system, OmpR family, sensor histidine kinase BaeS
MQVVAKEKGLVLEVPDFPACSVYGEPDRLRQHFFNLIDNAIKYTPADGLIIVSSGFSNGSVRVEVKDSGTGIPSSDLPRVFDRFYRADPSRSRAVDGTGLGLAICRSISEAHGGHIAVKNNAGTGCTVTVEFPIATVGIQSGKDKLEHGDGARQ